LTEELLREGHEVTLFASGDSVTSGQLVGTGKVSLREAGTMGEGAVHHILQLERLFREVARFDIVHFHVDYQHFPFSRRQREPHLTTLHGRLDLPELIPLYQEYAEMPVCSISDAQRRPLPWLRWQGTVLHGLPFDLYRFHPRSRGYLAFLGRISPEKGLDRAIAIAEQTGRTLRIAAKIDPADRDYYQREIAPLMAASRRVEFLGEIGEKEKNDFLGGADALLFPINWPEPFGLVMIEAMACGTPVIAFDGGSVREVIVPGENGFIAGSVPEAAARVGELSSLSRLQCRRRFERGFSARRMARDYVRLYEKVAQPFGSLRRERRGSRGRVQRGSELSAS
jgi:glycosyltransferase involved in cell wall biosynthesis